MAAAQMLVFRLDNFCTTFKDDFQVSRSKQLNHGKLGWRRSTSIKITQKSKNKEGTLSLIKKLFPPTLRNLCLTLKESPNKDALHKLTDEQLAKVGAQRIVTEDFFVEPISVQAADLSEEVGDV